MRQLFDTSALVAALVDGHEQHERALPYLDRALGEEVELVISAHAIAELYATLTVLEISPTITPGQAQYIIKENVLSAAEIVGLEGEDYAQVMQRMRDLGLVSGAIYDGLHVRAGEKAGVQQIVTCNGRDFRRMPPAEPIELVVL